MAQVLLFHHALGLTQGLLDFAQQLRQEGHVVHAPDLYGGRTFDDLEQGVAHAKQLGFSRIIERGEHAAQGLVGPIVYAGFSLGVLSAQKLAQTRSNASGALLFHACIDASEFAAPWPRLLPVQIHAMQDDPYFVGADLDAARALVASAEQAQLFLYPGNKHLFAEAGAASYDAKAAGLMMRCVLDFLARR